MNFLSKKIMRRYFVVSFVLGVAAACVVAKVGYLMFAEHDRWIGVSQIQVKQGRTLPAKRGNILAADGRVLAASLPEFYINLDYISTENDTAWSREDRYLKDTTLNKSLNLACQEVHDVFPKTDVAKLRQQLLQDWRVKDQYRRDTVLFKYLDDICRGMHRIFPDIDPAALRKHLIEGRRERSRYWKVYVDEVTSLKLRKNENRRISYVEYSEVSKLPLFNLRSSANFEKVEMRRRPFGELAIRTIGDFKDTARYGIEMTFDSVLAGKPGKYHSKR